jgi:hypothetical protein
MHWPSQAMLSLCLSEGFRSKKFFFEKKNQKTSIDLDHGRDGDNAHDPE